MTEKVYLKGSASVKLSGTRKRKEKKEEQKHGILHSVNE